MHLNVVCQVTSILSWPQGINYNNCNSFEDLTPIHNMPYSQKWNIFMKDRNIFRTGIVSKLVKLPLNADVIL